VSDVDPAGAGFSFGGPAGGSTGDSGEPAPHGDAPHDGAEGHKNPLEHALELCLYAPVGIAVTVAEDLPELITRGRRRVELQLSNARIVGRFVVGRGQRQVTSRLDQLVGSVAGAGEGGDAGGARGAAPAKNPDAGANGPTAPREPVPPTPPLRAAPDPVAEAVVGHALADYDTLSASQVVRRLESLGPDELRAVQRYEAATRNRRTILNRASQLLEERPAGPVFD
jgi:hypothetical protein